MTKTTYIPRGDSLPSKVLEFFRQNPDEELTIDDIASKYAAARNSVHTNLSKSVDAHMVQRSRNDDGEYVYKAGPALGTSHNSKAAQTAPVVAAPVPEYVVEDGVAIPPKLGELSLKLKDLMESLQPGQSSAVPIRQRDTLNKLIGHANGENKKQFVSRRINEAQIRVWRTA